MKKNHPAIRQSALVASILACALPALAQTNKLGPAITGTPPPANGAPGSGLVDDWLRKQSDGFSKWDIGGQVRVRYEDKDQAGFIANRDFISGRDANNDDVLVREKIHVGFTPVDWLNFYVEALDAHSLDDARHPSPDRNIIDIHQAYITFGNVNDFPLVLKVGRQEMLYGDERFVGLGDWSNTGRSFDAARLRYQNDFFWVDVFTSEVVVPYDERFDQPNYNDVFSGIYASSRKLIPWQETDLFFFARDADAKAPSAYPPGISPSPSGPRDVFTYGTRMKSLPGKLAGWDYSTEVAGQFGSVSQTGVRRDLEAMAADAQFGYTFEKATWTPRVGLGFTYASGDSNPNDGKDQTFETLFGTNHKFYGVMDLWGLRNIYSGRIVASVKPVKKLTLSTEYHLIWLADTADFFYPESGPGRAGNGYGRNPGFSSFVGSELDVLASYALAPYADLQLGYGHFFVGDYIRQSVNSVPANGPSADANWFYAQIKFNF